jgi:hypothetical protein
MMKKWSVTGAVAMAVVAVVMMAGCTSPSTPSPTPTPMVNATTAAAREVAEVCDGCSETYLVDPKTFACAVEKYLRHQGA